MMECLGGRGRTYSPTIQFDHFGEIELFVRQFRPGQQPFQTRFYLPPFLGFWGQMRLIPPLIPMKLCFDYGRVGCRYITLLPGPTVIVATAARVGWKRGRYPPPTFRGGKR